MKLPMLQAKTISLLDAPELREYLLASPEWTDPGRENSFRTVRTSDSSLSW